ncbi:hypothetical protein Daus18300_008160 [Diaporthe australafricana]|uniref:Ent-kaurene synthase n=1 Tax=Diaporthe australafricana TaxID=127596 RepID=A0ABR3WJL3_9PEZI
MHASEWDQDAERYLRTVLRQGTSQSKSCVPCAWPTTLFEVSWTVTTLAHSGITIQEKESAVLRKLLQHALAEGQGRVGFTATSLVPDADDTAKAIMALRYLGETDVSVRPLVETFESSAHFLTYPGERNPSFSTNCNVLMCLGMLQDPLLYKSQIIKTARFLCDQVFHAQIIDKWHRSQLYSIMLLSQALAQLYSSGNTALLNEVSIEDPILFNELIPIISIQVLIMTISPQEEDGSWEGMCELTAYAMLALSSLAHLPWLHCDLEMYGIAPCIARGKSYLKAAGQDEWVKGKHIWIEKVTYASPLLSEIYCQAAMQIPLPKQHDQANGSSTLYSTPVLPNPKILGGMRKAGALMARTALLGPSKLQQSLLHAAELQAVYALRELERRKLDVFPSPAGSNNSTNGVKKDTYLMFVPLTWTACSALHGGTAASLYVLREMMVLSMLVYQADEYIEGVVEQNLDMQLGTVGSLVTRIVRDEQAGPPDSDTARQRNGSHNAARAVEMSSALADTDGVLRKFVSHVLCHPSVLSCPAKLRARLAGEVEAFLLAHLMQAEDNRALAHRRRHGKDKESQLGSNGFHSGSASAQNGNTSVANAEAMNGQKNGRDLPSAGRSFYSWVRSTSAEHTSCPCAFVFFDCLVGSSSPSHSFFDLFDRSAKTAYVAEDLCRHLASMCRMYNDYASVARDRLEGNLNSVDFAEFHGDGQEVDGDVGIEDNKAQLMWIAEYERKGMDVAMARLEEEMSDNGKVGRDLLDAVKLFVSVTDLYGQVYVIRDITNHVK